MPVTKRLKDCIIVRQMIVNDLEKKRLALEEVQFAFNKLKQDLHKKDEELLREAYSVLPDLPDRNGYHLISIDGKLYLLNRNPNVKGDIAEVVTELPIEK